MWLFTESGYLDGAAWDIVLTCFSELWHNAHGNLLATVLVDNLGIHRNAEILERAHSKLVNLFFLPPNTSHFLQPLDDLVFAKYKTTLELWATRYAAAIRKNGQRRTSTELITAVVDIAFEAAFDKATIIKSWKNTFMWPFDEEGLERAARLNVGEIVKEEKISSPRKGKLTPKEVRDMTKKVFVGLAERNGEVTKKIEDGSIRLKTPVNWGVAYDTESFVKLNREKRLDEERTANERAAAKLLKEQEKAARTAAAAAKAEERAVKKRARDEEALIKSCRVSDCGLKWNTRSKGVWMWCEGCDQFGVCPDHWAKGKNGSGQKQMRAHESSCPLCQAPQRKKAKKE